jgi:hypothetical protein
MRLPSEEAIIARLEAQEFECAICGSEGYLSVDQCPITGDFRGMLCGSCQKMIATLHDDPETVFRAMDYRGDFQGCGMCDECLKKQQENHG